MKWHLYILLCDSESYYVGITKNLEGRIAKHMRKESRYTKRFEMLKLVYTEEYETEKEAIIKRKAAKRMVF